MKNKSRNFPDQVFQNFFITDRQERRLIAACGFFLTVFFAALFFFKPTLLQPLDFKNYDLLLRHFPNNYGKSMPVIIDIDEKSLSRYGQWPWPRYLVAELFEKIIALEPAVIGIDMIFAEPDRASPIQLLKDIEKSHQLKLAIDGIPEELNDNDKILAETLAKGPFVLGHKFQFNRPGKSSEQCVLHPVKVSVMQTTGGRNKNTGIPESTGLLCNLPILGEKASAEGFLNCSPDNDGVLRRVPLLIQHNNDFYPSLALAVFLKFKNDSNLLLKKDGDILQTINCKGASVPVDLHGQLLVKYRGPSRSFEHMPAADILDGSVSSKRLQEKIIFVGAAATGMSDLQTTPFGSMFPGVEVHATVVDNLLSGDFIAVPSWSNGLVMLLILALGVFLSLFIAFYRSVSVLILFLLIIVGVWLMTQQAFFRTGLFIGTAYPIAATLCSYISLAVLKNRLEEKRIFVGMRELLLTQDITIESLADLAEYRDLETGNHIKRTRKYVKLLAEHIKEHDKYKHCLSDAKIDILYKSAPLHDIGKVGIQDNILRKPGPLTKEEFEAMKAHTSIGRDVIEASSRKLGKKSFLTNAAEIAYSHHEKWDGSGYPQGLKGDAIPISARLMALADVYDALISERPYKQRFSHVEALDIIRKGRGTQFDPDIVDAFLEIHEQFRNIAREFSDPQEKQDILKTIHRR